MKLEGNSRGPLCKPSNENLCCEPLCCGQEFKQLLLLGLILVVIEVAPAHRRMTIGD